MKPKKLVREKMVDFIPDQHFERINTLTELNVLYELKIKEELQEIKDSGYLSVSEFADLIDIAMAFAQENGFELEQLHEASSIKEEKKGVYTNLALNNLMSGDPKNSLYFEPAPKFTKLKAIQVPASSYNYEINSGGGLKCVVMNGTTEQHRIIGSNVIGESLDSNIHELIGWTLLSGDYFVLYKDK